jgi:hypothetical protein
MEMDTLGRWAPYLTMAGGALFTLALIIVTFSPTSPAWYGMFAATVLLGGAVAGLYWQTRPATGRLGLTSAWLAGLGSVVAVPVTAYGIASGEFSNLQAQNASMTPSLAVAFAAFTAWLVGSLGFAVALVRRRTLSRLGAWLVLAGALVAVVTTPLYGMTVDPTLTALLTLLFGLMPVGWIVIGYAAYRRTAANGAATDSE